MTGHEKQNRYLERDSCSFCLYQQATGVMPGGNSRTTVFTPPYPMYVERGHGCRVVDVEGQERIDFVNNLTSLILGHAHPKVVDAPTPKSHQGSAFSWPTESDVRLAQILVAPLPSVEHVRFT